ncbi:MAG: FadR/GntR family transcriptional regulator [Anaerotignum sp.]
MDYYKGKMSLSDEVYNQILHKITNEEWKVGDKLPSENKLCTSFGVSRTSVRAALQNLQGSGIIITMQGVGSFVHRNPLQTATQEEQAERMRTSDITSEEFKEFFEFRQAIEFKAIEFFVRRATKEDEAILKDLVAKMQEAARENDINAFTRYDFEFHMTVIQATKNIFLYNAMLNCQDIFFHYMEEIARLTDKPLSVLAEEHFELYTYLVEKKPKWAKDYLFSDNTYYHVAYFNGR